MEANTTATNVEISAMPIELTSALVNSVVSKMPE